MRLRGAAGPAPFLCWGLVARAAPVCGNFGLLRGHASLVAGQHGCWSSIRLFWPANLDRLKYTQPLHTAEGKP